MANLTIFGLVQLTSAGADLSADLVPVWDNSALETKKMTLSDLRTLMSPVNWSDSFSSATQATSSWTPNNAAADINAAIIPKGSGSIINSIPDGTAVGGNARGSSSIDLQVGRNAANQVAGGSLTFIIGGIRNRIVTNATRCSIFGGEDNVIAAGQWGNNILAGTRNQIVSGAGNDNAIAGGLDNIISTGVSSGFVAGSTNTVSGNRGTITGGISNTASGQFSAIGGGQSNTASQQWATVAGGWTNTASGTYSVVCGGRQNSATNNTSGIVAGQQNSVSGELNFLGAGYLNSIQSGCHYSALGAGRNNVISSQFAFIGCGDANQVSGYAAIIGGGGNNRASANYASVIGGFEASASLYGQVAHASGRFDLIGDAQAQELVWRRTITGTAQTELFLDGASTAAILPQSGFANTASVWHGIIDIIAICSTVGAGTTVFGDVEASSFKVTIKRVGQPTATTSLVGTVQEIGTTNSNTSMATGVFTIDNNDTNESLRIRYTPPTTAAADTVIRVVATFRGTQILTR